MSKAEGCEVDAPTTRRLRIVTSVSGRCRPLCCSRWLRGANRSPQSIGSVAMNSCQLTLEGAQAASAPSVGTATFAISTASVTALCVALRATRFAGAFFNAAFFAGVFLADTFFEA